MKKSIVFSSASGNTKSLAVAISEKLGSDVYCGKPQNEALESDLVFVGFWTTKNSCSTDIANFLEKLENKKIFLFGTAGYNDTKAYFDEILGNVKTHISSSNEVVGSFMSLAKVTAAKQESIKEMDLAKYNSIKDKMQEGENHPTSNDIQNLLSEVAKVL